MIPKAAVLERARIQGLQATTVEKDYVLGWVLWAITEDEVLNRWVFKGGTCLKKCFFETYRFSELCPVRDYAERRVYVTGDRTDRRGPAPHNQRLFRN
ncbi:MAG: nucleotidyl transferase AbiEii/AbiGii toxin family protein [Proteobacteria bacterium]|nr:nucleotidyl transferase AbiEii/AbiGii toxin family protein [Pseudomonadota bacterium]